jgi:hypothetical protein
MSHPNSAKLSRDLCFLCGLRYTTAELYFLRCPCHGYIKRVCLQLRRVLVEFLGSKVIEQEMARRLRSDLKC